MLIAVVVLAVALVGVLVYFLVLKSPSTLTVPSSNNNQGATQSSQSTQASMITLAFERGVENWLGLECIYNKYGGNATLNAINDTYKIAYNYLYEYEYTNNITYYIVYPIAQYQYLVSNYANCAVSESDQSLVSTVTSALSNFGTVAMELNMESNIPSNYIGTPLFIVFNRANNITYVIVGASPSVFYAINYSKAGNITTFTYQGHELGYGFKANSTQVAFINELSSSGLGIGNSNANVTVIEYLDPECPACTIFQLEYGGYLDHLIGSGSIYYVIQYFPTHVLDYGCSSPTIEPMLGTICQG
ncbi:hypothetical protein GCM10007112_15320 [Vulcanisaeta souniana JCM 11219]|uniref:Thioredoxin-like fold domain-containing protein n=1 Tax=Vulcanisaeta souniana JCM 11219 TaxID=1293586 RepID=A0A830E3K0_9CREN|nr:hypothetical protein GCM10007112_15320 [Vulcanisaeta souniana JCM 11219]